ncbi:MAG: PAS domain S-box protein, partial [Desulfococcaceae bacterium]
AKSEARYRLLADQAPLAVMVTDMETERVVYVNHMFTRLFETDEAEATAATFTHFLVDLNDGDLLRQRLSDHGFVNDFEVGLKKPSKTEFWASVASHVSMYQNRPAIHSVIHDVSKRKQAEEDRTQLIAELREALEKVEQLEGILPICSFCKGIRDEEGNWQRMEDYISRRSKALFSHSFCPECAKIHYPEFYS